MLARLHRTVLRHISPLSALQEAIYGLVMSLATISVVALTVGLDESTRLTIALAALGVNITWGLADMLIFGVLESFDRSRHARMVEQVFSAPEEDWALEAVREDLEGTIVSRLDPADRERIYLDVLESGARSLEPHPRFSREVLRSSLLSFVITVATALPVVAIMMLVVPVHLAFQVSSVTVVLLLFLTGFTWAPIAGVSRWRAGLVLTGIGLLITLSTLVIGG